MTQKPWLSSYPEGVPAEVNVSAYSSLLALMQDSFKQFGDRPAFHFMGRDLSYAQLDRLSQVFGAYLQSLGLVTGDRVAIMLPNVLQYPIAVAAVLRAGFVVVNINPLYTSRELEAQLTDADAKAIVVLENFGATLQECLARTPVKHVVLCAMGDRLGWLKGMLVNHVVRKVKKMVPSFELPTAVRFNDALTLGVNSRFFDTVSGAEMVRVGVAQRVRFSDQRVVLPGQAASSAGLSDILFGAGIRWDTRWSIDATLQANNQTHEIGRTTFQGNYRHSPYRVINMAYRANNQVKPYSEFVDVGWQWPLSDLVGNTDRQAETAWSRTPGQGLGPDRWYTVGRLNYSLKERSLVDTLLGLEYDAGCWLGRVAFQRLQTNVSAASPTSSNSRILFQLEFIGFARVGLSPLKSLSDNIPRYQYLRDSTVQPSRFQHYE